MAKLTLFLNSQVFPGYKKEQLIYTKLSIMIKRDNFHSKIITFEYSNDNLINNLIDQKEIELLSLLNGLKQLKPKKIKKLNITKVKIVTKETSFFELSLNLLETWEYLNFKNTPYKEIWQEIYNILIDLDIDIIQ